MVCLDWIEMSRRRKELCGLDGPEVHGDGWDLRLNDAAHRVGEGEVAVREVEDDPIALSLAGSEGASQQQVLPDR